MPSTNPTPTRFQSIEGAVQEDIPVVRIHLSRIEEFEASEMSLSNDASILVSDPIEDFYENMEALFAKSVDEDEDLAQLRVGFLEPCEHVEDTRIGTQGLYIKSKMMIQRLKLQAPKKNGIGIRKWRYPGPGGLVIGRPIQKVMKSEDHG